MLLSVFETCYKYLIRSPCEQICESVKESVKTNSSQYDGGKETKFSKATRTESYQQSYSVGFGYNICLSTISLQSDMSDSGMRQRDK